MSSAWSRLLRLLSSRQLSFVLLAAWAGLLAMWVIPFQATGLDETQVASIAATWLPFRIVYAVLVVTTLACVTTRVSTDLRRVRSTPRVPADPWLSLSPSIQGLDMSLEEAESRLSDRGWRTDRKGATLVAHRARGAALGGSVFHLGILLFVVAVAAYPNLSSSEEFRLIEGEQVGLSTNGGGSGLRAAVADATLERVSPRYFRDVLLFEKLDATWRRADGRRETFALASPLWVDPLTIVSIQDFGLAPHLVVRDSNGVVQDSTAAMSIFPPGAEDEIDLQNATLRVTLSAFTDYGVVGGKDVSLSYNIKNPRLRVAVSPWEDPERVIARGLLSPGESIAIDHTSGARYELVFEELRQYGSFRVTRSWAMPLLALAGFMMVVGMGFRLWRPRAEMVVWESADGLAVAARVDRVGISPADMASSALMAESDHR